MQDTNGAKGDRCCQQAGDTHTAEETRHVEEAFASALVLSVSLALLASVLAALAVSWYFSRRVQRSIGDVAAAAADIAAGRYDARVPDPPSSPPHFGEALDPALQPSRSPSPRRRDFVEGRPRSGGPPQCAKID